MHVKSAITKNRQQNFLFRYFPIRVAAALVRGKKNNSPLRRLPWRCTQPSTRDPRSSNPTYPHTVQSILVDLPRKEMGIFPAGSDGTDGISFSFPRV